MGYFDGLVSGSFKQDASGRTLFFPYGVLGKGKLAPSEAAAQSLKTGLKIYYMITLPVIIVASILYGFLASMAAAAVMIVAYEIWIRGQTASWTRSGESLTYAESTRNSAVALGKGTLIALLVVSLLFVATGIAMIFAVPDSRWIGVLSTVFFGACSVAFMYMLRRRAAS